MYNHLVNLKNKKHLFFRSPLLLQGTFIVPSNKKDDIHVATALYALLNRIVNYRKPKRSKRTGPYETAQEIWERKLPSLPGINEQNIRIDFEEELAAFVEEKIKERDAVITIPDDAASSSAEQKNGQTSSDSDVAMVSPPKRTGTAPSATSSIATHVATAESLQAAIPELQNTVSTPTTVPGNSAASNTVPQQPAPTPANTNSDANAGQEVAVPPDQESPNPESGIRRRKRRRIGDTSGNDSDPLFRTPQ